MKTKEELNTIKDEVETLNTKFSELSDGELVQVAGGDETDANIVGCCTVPDIRQKGSVYPVDVHFVPEGLPEPSPVPMENESIFEEYSNMIKIQRGYQSNSKIVITQGIIKVSNTISKRMN